MGRIVQLKQRRTSTAFRVGGIMGSTGPRVGISNQIHHKGSYGRFVIEEVSTRVWGVNTGCAQSPKSIMYRRWSRECSRRAPVWLGCSSFPLLHPETISVSGWLGTWPLLGNPARDLYLWTTPMLAMLPTTSIPRTSCYHYHCYLGIEMANGLPYPTLLATWSIFSLPRLFRSAEITELLPPHPPN